MKSHYIKYRTQESASSAITQNASIPLKVERMLAAQNSMSSIRTSDLTVSLTRHFRSLFLRKFNKQEESGELFHFNDYIPDSLGYSRAF